MATLKLALQVDSNNPNVGDLFLENGTVRLTASLLEEAAQALWVRLKSFQGEWFLDPTLGFPWLQSVLGQKTPLAILQQMFRFAVLTTPGVASLAQFDLRRTPNRGIALTFRAVLADGTVLTEKDFAPFVVPKLGA